MFEDNKNFIGTICMFLAILIIIINCIVVKFNFIDLIYFNITAVYLFKYICVKKKTKSN